MLFSVVGQLVMVSASNMMTLYLGLELQSLALYVLAAFARDDLRSSEAGLKYFVLSGLASGLLLYGISLVYGFSGTMDFAELRQALADPAHASAGVIVGVVFVFTGLAFKVSAVPFHMWTPDVYEGAPTPVTTFFATAPKVAAMALLLRVMGGTFGSLLAQWQPLIILVSIASMVLGALAAIGQSNIKRLMAYSSIGHMGFALIGLAVGTAAGVRGTLVYMLIYVFMTAGAFACIIAMRRNGRAVEKISDLSGLAATDPPTGDGAGGVHVQPGRHPGAVGLLRQAVHLPCGGAGRPVDALHHRRADQRGGRLLLYPRRQSDVFRCAGGGVRPAPGLADLRRRRDRAVHDILLSVPGALRRCGAGSGESPVRMTGQGWRLRCFASLPSTSDHCVSLAATGEPDGLAVLALRQTAGRGSRGRIWESPPGNLYLSVLLRPEGLATEVGRWALLALAWRWRRRWRRCCPIERH